MPRWNMTERLKRLKRPSWQASPIPIVLTLSPIPPRTHGSSSKSAFGLPLDSCRTSHWERLRAPMFPRGPSFAKGPTQGSTASWRTTSAMGRSISLQRCRESDSTWAKRIPPTRSTAGTAARHSYRRTQSCWTSLYRFSRYRRAAAQSAHRRFPDRVLQYSRIRQ